MIGIGWVICLAACAAGPADVARWESSWPSGSWRNLFEAAQENLLAAVNKRALTLAEDNRLEEAAQVVLAGMAYDPHDGRLGENDLHVHQRWIAELCAAGEFARAAEVVEQGFVRRPEAALFDDGRLIVYRQWADALLDRGDVDQALAVLAQARRQLADRPEEVQQQEALLIRDHSLRWMKLGRVEQARRLWRRGLALQPENAALGEDEKLATFAK